MVEIPTLALDRQNWKNFRAKLIEAAATQHVLGLLAGWEVEPDNDESDEWDDWFGYDAVAKFLIYPTLPLELLRPIWKLHTAHEMFEFLAHQFHDYDPIEWDAQMNKAKTYANEEVNNGQAGAANMHTKNAYQTFEPAGIAAESPENPQRSGDGQVTNNGSENAMHQAEMMQKWQKTFAGTCYRCGEVGHRARNCRLSNDMPKCSAKGQTTMDGRKRTRRHDKCNNSTTKVNGTALLGGEPAKRAPKVDEAMRSDPLRLTQAQTNFKENQCNGNAKIDIPSAYGLPLKGEWLVCASGEAGCEMGMSESASIHNEAEVFAQTPAECCQQLHEADGNPSCRKVKPMDTTNVSEAPVTMSVDSENLGNGDMLRMYLGSTNWHAGDPNGLGNRMDVLTCQVDVSTGYADVLRVWTDTLDVPSSTETASVSQGDDAETYLGIGDVKHAVFEMDGVRSHADTPTGHGEAPSVKSNTTKPVNVMEIVRTPQKKSKPPDSPIATAKQRSDSLNSIADHTDGSRECTDAQSVGNVMETTTNTQEIISMRLIASKWPNPLTMGANACANKPNGCRNPAETLTGHGEAPGVKMDTDTTANVIEIVRASPNEPKLPNLPIQSARSAPDEPNGCRNRSDASSGCMDVHSTGNDAQTAIDEAKTIRTPPNEPKMQNIPAGGKRRHAGVAGSFRSHMDMFTM